MIFKQRTFDEGMVEYLRGRGDVVDLQPPLPLVLYNIGFNLILEP